MVSLKRPSTSWKSFYSEFRATHKLSSVCLTIILVRETKRERRNSPHNSSEFTRNAGIPRPRNVSRICASATVRSHVQRPQRKNELPRNSMSYRRLPNLAKTNRSRQRKKPKQH